MIKGNSRDQTVHEKTLIEIIHAYNLTLNYIQ